MSRNKKLAKGLGAGALAIATLTSGLSFGAASASAAPAADSRPSARAIDTEFDSAPAPLVGKLPDGRFWSNSGITSGSRLFSTFEEAKSHSAQWIYNSLNKTLRDARSGSCIVEGNNLLTVSVPSYCTNPSASTTFSFEDGHLHVASQPGREITNWRASSVGYPEFTNSGTTPWEIVAAPGLSAQIESRDVDGRTAVLVGRAQAGSFVTISWGADETVEVQVGEDGEWTYELERLKLGKNPVHLEQYVDQKKTGEFDLDVELKIADLTVEHEFGADRDDLVTLSGTAQPGAIVQALDENGNMIVASDEVPNSGDWAVELPAPNKAGAYDFDVVQSYGGEQTGKTAVSIDYGKQLVVTRPEDGFAHTGGKLKMSGTGEPGSRVEVHEGSKLVGSANVFQSSQWNLTTTEDLNASEHTLTVTQKSKGGNVQTDTVVLNEGETAVPAPAAEVVFDADVTQKAKIVGTARDGATVTIRDSSNAVIGAPQVVNGAFELALTGAFGLQDYTITQSIDGETSPETPVTADFGQAVEVTATNTNGTVTVTGTSSRGAKITLTSGGREFGSFDVTNTDGTFSRTLTGLGQGNIVITATAKSKGALSSTDTASLSLPVTAASVTFTSHPDRTFTPGAQVFAGKATPGTTITLNPFGWEAGYASANLTTTVNQFGEWEISRGLGNTTYAMFSIKQTAQQGVTNELNKLNMRPFAEVGEPADLTMNFTAGDFFTPGMQTFTGRATPGAQVTLNPFGFTNPAYAGYNITVVADSTGQWSIPRTLGNTTYRELAVKQDSPDASKVNLIENIFLAPTGWLGDPADLTDTTTSFTHTPGQAFTFTGTARPGTTVTLYPFGTDYPDYALTTTVKATGTWSITRQLGNQVFPVVITQDNADGQTDRIEHTMTPTTN
ncbi:hypothetical protein ACRQ4C_02930 [Curtobacterium sp. SP.BCp]|uniref:hypothetical protein n=1 Tax=Curtobacterium sp. SP.BCp TaxID=3435230 RepID=UPI003F73F4B2